MVYTQIIFDIHSDSFIQKYKLSLSHNLQSFISQILKVAGLLAEKFKFFILLGYWNGFLLPKHENQAPLFKSFKTVLEQQKSGTWSKNDNLKLYCTEF